jgi:predicted RNase H-like HicB family nuclease
VLGVTGSDRGARNYIAVISRDRDHGFRVDFPDLPGRCAFAAAFDEASSEAAAALAVALDAMERDGVALPEPSSFTAILSNPKYRDGVAIRVHAPRAPTVRADRDREPSSQDAW